MMRILVRPDEVGLQDESGDFIVRYLKLEALWILSGLSHGSAADVYEAANELLAV